MPVVASDPFFVAFGEAVRTMRKERGLTQDRLAELAQVHRSYLVDIEAGRRNVALYNIKALARALSVRPSELLAAAESLERPPVGR